MGTIQTHIIASNGISQRSCIGVPGVILFSSGCISYITAVISIVFKYEIMIIHNKQKKVSKDILKHMSSGNCMVHFTLKALLCATW